MISTDKITAIIARELGVTEQRCNPEATLADLGADSMDMVCIAVSLEEAFSIDLHEGVEDGWRTVGDIVAAVEGVMA